MVQWLKTAALSGGSMSGAGGNPVWRALPAATGWQGTMGHQAGGAAELLCARGVPSVTLGSFCPPSSSLLDTTKQLIP